LRVVPYAERQGKGSDMGTPRETSDTPAPDGPDGEAPPLGVPTRWHLPLLLVFCLILYGQQLGRADLSASNESNRAEAAREMLATGDYVVPRINGLLYLDKPPLIPWVIAGIAGLTGRLDALTGRLPSVVAGLLIVAVVYAFLRGTVGASAAFLSALLCATCPAIVLNARRCDLDMTVCLTATTAILSFHRGCERKGHWWLLTSVALALCAMTKGPPPVFIFALTAGPYLLSRRQYGSLYSWRMWLGLAIFLALVLPWPLAILHAHAPEAMRTWYGQTLGRTLTASRINRGPVYFYFGSVAGLLMPWTLLLPAAVWDGIRGRGEDRGLLRLLFWWIVPSFVVFSASAAKESEYILPLYPTFCILIGTAMARFFEGRLAPRPAALAQWGFYGVAAVAAVSAVALPVMVAAAEPDSPLPWIVFLLCAIPAGALALLARRRMFRFMPLAVCALVLAGWYGFASARAITENAGRSPRRLCERVAPLIAPSDDVVSYPAARSSFSFYLGRTIHPIQDPQALQERLSGGESVVCLVRLEDLQSLRRAMGGARGQVLSGGLLGRTAFAWVRWRKPEPS
jgi:4-amino-4-deoxy-L-arabinose transferase-like glycosyltransferase